MKLANPCAECWTEVYRAWNQKNLDYEIETGIKHDICVICKVLEIKRTSITRLKLDARCQSESPKTTWNQKNLDYEIETMWLNRLPIGLLLLLKSKEPRLRDWNSVSNLTTRGPEIALKSKEPRLRDWNWLNTVDKADRKALKSKEPRLRDWNIYHSVVIVFRETLEIKRTSITRLKRKRWLPIQLGRELEIKRTSITRLKQLEYRCFYVWIGLEIKRTSITRLKHDIMEAYERRHHDLKSKEPRLRDWNWDSAFIE